MYSSSLVRHLLLYATNRRSVYMNFLSILLVGLLLLPVKSFAENEQLWMSVLAPTSGAFGDLDQDNYKEYYFWGKETILENNFKLYSISWDGVSFNQKIINNTQSLDFFGILPRNISARIIAIGDVNGDGKQDVVTSSGALVSSKSIGGGKWMPLPIDASEISFSNPVIFEESSLYGQKNSILVVSDFLNIYQCTFAITVTCEKRYDSGYNGPVGSYIDAITGDFDGDKKKDIIIGFHNPILDNSLIFYGKDIANPSVINISAVDFNAGDINGDGYDDLVAQISEKISDFPSTTQIWLGSKLGLQKVGDFGPIGNFDNHTDNSSLVDVNVDGCLDYLQIGADSYGFGYKLSSKSSSGQCIPFSFDKKWDAYGFSPMTLPSGYSSGSMGVQVMDLNNNSKPEVFIRFGWGDHKGEAKHLSVIKDIDIP